MEFRLQQETLFLAVRLADRFLSNARVSARAARGVARRPAEPARGRGPSGDPPSLTTAPAALQAVPRNMLQLVAVTCVLLAAKQEEVSRPRLCRPALSPPR